MHCLLATETKKFAQCSKFHESSKEPGVPATFVTTSEYCFQVKHHKLKSEVEIPACS